MLDFATDFYPEHDYLCDCPDCQLDRREATVPAHAMVVRVDPTSTQFDIRHYPDGLDGGFVGWELDSFHPDYPLDAGARFDAIRELRRTQWDSIEENRGVDEELRYYEFINWGHNHDG